MRKALLIAWLALHPWIAGGAGAQQVTLPLEQYENLRARAGAEGDAPPPPPAPWALEAADYEVKAGAESARVVQRLRFTLFDDKWQSLPLGEAGAFIRADFRGLEGRVDVAGGAWVLQVRGRGAHEVVLESAVPVIRDETATRPTWRFGLRFPAAAVVRGHIEAPGAVEEVESEGPGLVRRGPEGWTFVALPNGEVRWTLSGRATLPRRALLPLRFETTSATAATLSRTRLRVLGWIEARVAQGRLESLRVPVPAGLKVVAVRGPVAGWDLQGPALVITPLAPVEDSLAVEVELTGEPRETFETPLLTLEGSARALLLAKAALRGDGLLSLADPGSARGADEREEAKLPASLKEEEGGRLFAVPDVRRPPRWEAVWAERTEVLAAQVDRLLVDVAVGESGRASYQLWAEVRNRGAQQLAVTPPAGFVLSAAHRDAAAVRPGADGQALSVPLLTQETPQVVHLEGVLPLALPREDKSFEVPLPALSVPAARVEMRVLLPRGRSYTLVESARAGSISPPSQTQARRPVSELARQVDYQVNTAARAVLSSEAPAFFSCPPGFVQYTASWSALSATPSPLALRVKAEKEKSPWF